MNDDDVYQLDGEAFQDTVYSPGIPAERIEAEAREAAIIASSYPVMEDVANWFLTQIADCNDLHNIQMTALTINGARYDRKTSIEAQVLAYQLLQEKLTEKFQAFKLFAGEDENGK